RDLARVRQREVEPRDAGCRRGRRRLAVQLDGRPTVGLAHDLDVEPPDVTPPAVPERLHRGFLGREAGGVALVAPDAALLAVALLAWREAARLEACAGLRILERRLEPRDLGDVDARPYDRHRSICAPLSTRRTLDTS